MDLGMSLADITGLQLACVTTHSLAVIIAVVHLALAARTDVST